MSFYTYVLYSPTYDQFYFGQTESLVDRILKHNNGSVRSTARYLPWEIYAYKESPTRKEAFSMEKQLKNCRNRDRMKGFLTRHEFSFQASQKVFGPENHNCL